MRVLAGTSGYSYPEWRGSFYPAELPTDEMLAFYAQRLPAVEVNNTFYRVPKKHVVEAWAAAVPESFRFVPKATRRITHQKRLRDVGDEVAFVFEQFAPLGERLGAVLFQLPPTSKLDLPRLAAFLDALPAGARVALEFRHASWSTDETHALLGERGVALVGDDEGALVPTTDWGYVRMRGEEYDDAALTGLAARARLTGWKEVFVFFKHEDGGVGADAARRFLELAG